MVTLSAFGDEVAADLIEQMDVMEREGIRHIKEGNPDIEQKIARFRERAAAGGKP